MSRETRKRAYVRLGALLPALTLSVGVLMAPTALAADGSPLPVNSDNEGIGMDGNEVAAAVSGVLTAALMLTCTDPQSHVIICRVNSNNTPFGSSN
ncbi:hypothetical protein [Streptomyces sp. NPDC001450]